MFKKPMGLLGIFLVVVGVGFFVGAGVAYTQVQNGYTSLQDFSAAQNVQLSYDEDGNLVDRGSAEEGQAILDLVEKDWGYPVTSRELDPNDPLVNTASEYMVQMGTISYHTLHGEQNVTLTQDQIDAAIESGALEADGTYNGVVEQYQGEVLTPGTYTVPVNGRYWTGFDRTDILDGPAREMAWSGTAHALVAELGVGAATHSALKLGLGIAALLAGLGVVCTVMGAAFIWDTKRKGSPQVPDTVPEALVQDQPTKVNA